ncbi:MAG TPA: hypothetical protein DEV81_00345, partial [Cyanobacteria bacterium UBA11049]|nr:hypothetical protein [Cyanobacteria bacterium UBA11049]
MNQPKRLMNLNFPALAAWCRLPATFLILAGLAWTCITGIALASEWRVASGEAFSPPATSASSAPPAPSLRENLTKQKSIQPYFERVSK